MTKTSMTKRAAALFLAMLCLPITLIMSACSGGGDTADPAELYKYAYKQTVSDIPKGEYVNSMVTVGDSLYIYAYSYDEEYNETYRLYTMPIGGGEVSVVREYPSPNTQSQEDDGSSVNVYTYRSQFKSTGDGIRFLENVNTDSYNAETDEYSYSSSYYLCTMDTSGNETGRVDLSAVVPLEEDEYFYVNNYALDSSGTAYILGDILYVIDASGQYKGEVDFGGNYYYNMFTSASGDIYLMAYVSETGNMDCRKVDLASMALSDSVVLENFPRNYYNFISIPGYTVGIVNEEGLFGYSIESKTLTKIMDWLDSDIDFYSLDTSGMTATSDGAFYSISTDWGGEEVEASVLRLTKLDPAEAANKTVITLAVTRLDYDLQKGILDFNRRSDKYRITVNNYYNYNTETEANGAVTTLNNDILAGKIPDILLASDIPLHNYIAQGFIADLNPVIDADTTFNRGDYLENVFKALEVDGKMYSIIPHFNIHTAAAKTELVDGRTTLTPAEVKEILAALPDGAVAIGDTKNTEFLSSMVMMMKDRYIDPVTGKCRFDSREFIDLLELAATLPSLNRWEDPNFVYDQEYENRYIDNRVLLGSMYISSYEDYYWERTNVFGGEEITLVGYPTEEGNGAVIVPSMEFAMTSKANKNEDTRAAAWEFMKYFLTEDFQETGWALPVRLDSLDERAKQTLETFRNNVGFGDVIYETDIAVPYYNEAAVDDDALTVEDEISDEGEIDSSELETEPPAEEDAVSDAEFDKLISSTITADSNIAALPARIKPAPMEETLTLTQEDIDMITEYIKSVTLVRRYDEKLDNIVIEEASAFFSGAKTAQEVAANIQNRVQTYVNENR